MQEENTQIEKDLQFIKVDPEGPTVSFGTSGNDETIKIPYSGMKNFVFFIDDKMKKPLTLAGLVEHHLNELFELAFPLKKKGASALNLMLKVFTLWLYQPSELDGRVKNLVAMKELLRVLNALSKSKDVSIASFKTRDWKWIQDKIIVDVYESKGTV